MKTFFIDWNLIPYAEAWQRQTEWFDNIVRAKVQGESYENRIVMCEHPHVYTLGRSGKENNMLLSDEQLKAIDATLYHIDRGGDITYHGPGQLVCYPILNLEEFQLGLKEYVLNVNTDLRYFSYIHPCGFIDKGVTSLRQELKHDVPMDEVKQRLEEELRKLFQLPVARCGA